MISIRPKVAMYSAFSRLNYKPWFALAEFVDNSVQSFLTNRKGIQAVERVKKTSLEIRILLEKDRISISDNAAGISKSDFPRAFAPAQPPPDTSGLSEFGLGMKAAACWFARKWSVRTSALGEPVERTIHFDVPKIVGDGIEELAASERKAERNSHYTTIVLDALHSPPQGRTVGKMKSHLASIYRRFIANGSIQIFYNDEPLGYEEPQILIAPHFKRPDGPRKTWKKEFQLKLDSRHRVWGWAALRAKGSVSDAGFAVFRRDRLIQGSFDAPYRPEALFRKPNSFTAQRLFGELFVEGFQVSHTKDGLQWDQWEDDIVSWLKTELDKAPLPLLAQAEGHRVQAAPGVIASSWGESAVAETAAALEQYVPPVLAAQLEAEPEHYTPKTPLRAVESGSRKDVHLEIDHRNRRWMIRLEVVRDPAQEDWYIYRHAPPKKSTDPSQVTIRLNLVHPFSERFALRDEDEFEPLVRVAAGLAIAEVTALESGASAAATVRRNFNQLLREALGRP